MDWLISIDRLYEYLTVKNLKTTDDEGEIYSSIFEAVDKENSDGEFIDGGDGFLNRNEFEKFKKELETKSKKLFEMFGDFFQRVDNARDGKNVHDVIANNIIHNYEEDSISKVINILENVDDSNLLKVVNSYYKQMPTDFLSGPMGLFRKIADRFEYIDESEVENYKFKLFELGNKILNLAKINGIYTKDFEIRIDKIIKENELHKFGVAIDRLFERTAVKLDVNNEISANKRKIPLKEPNGAIDEKFIQGFTGNCWFVSAINAIKQDESLLKIINDKISVQKDGDEIKSVTVNIKNKDYVIDYEELINANEYSTGDLDVRAIEIALNRYLLEQGSEDISLGGNSKTVFDVFFEQNDYVSEQLIFDLNIIIEFKINTNTVGEEEKYEDSDVIMRFKEELKDGAVATLGSKMDSDESLYLTNNKNEKVLLKMPHMYFAKKVDTEFLYLADPHNPDEESLMRSPEFMPTTKRQ